MNKTLIIMCAAIAVGATAEAQKLEYPVSSRVDTVDHYFGTAVPDPYRWLEDDNSPQTAKWVDEQNEVTQNYLSKIPFRDAVRKKITELANYEKMGTPFIVAGKYYYFFNDGLQNQSVLYQTDKVGDKGRVVLDPNSLSDNGTVALQQVNFSKDGRYLAYTITRNGSDWNEIFVLDLATGKQMDDHIMWAKFTDAQWLGDGFFYSAYDAPKDAKSSINEFHKVMYHKLGTPQSEDYVEYRSYTQPLLFHHAQVTRDQRFVFVTESDGDGEALYVKDLKSVNPHYVCLANELKFQNNVVGVDGNRIFVHTNFGAPRWKVVAYDVDNLGLNRATTVVGEKEAVLSAAQMTDHKLLLTYDKDASNHAFLCDLDGKQLGDEIKLPAIGSVSFSTKNTSKEVFYRFTSYTFPPTIYAFDAENGQSRLVFAPKIALNPEDYVTEQVFYPSKDGTRIPMFMIYKKGLKKDGKRPVFLYGYGGFNISMNPGFSYSRTPFAMLDMGGICVYTNLRGGGEYGEQWHEAGTKLKKQNVFDDFIAAAEYLIKEGYTSKGKIACNGGSNGGLLVGAVVNQRPDLWGAAVAQVGVMDMLRYHKFTIGWNWAHDYGRSDDNRQMFEYLYGYSPLHNIKNDGTPYPPMLVTSGDHDDRVVPAHSFKYTATLQASNTGKAPKIIRIDKNAGHGHGKPISKVIDEYTDIQSFIMFNLGVKYKGKK